MLETDHSTVHDSTLINIKYKQIYNMAILNFQKPDKIVLAKGNDFEAQFEFRPLEPGFGVTIGNALTQGITEFSGGICNHWRISIEGVDHEFATIKGITEDVAEIILNLKQVRFKKKVDHEVAQEKINLSIKNKTEFTAGMIGEATHSFEVMNPELLICTLDHFRKTRYRNHYRQRPWLCSCRR